MSKTTIYDENKIYKCTQGGGGVILEIDHQRFHDFQYTKCNRKILVNRLQTLKNQKSGYLCIGRRKSPVTVFINTDFRGGSKTAQHDLT